MLHYGSCLDPGVAAKAPPLGTVTSSTSVAEQPPSRGTEPGGGARLAQIRWDRWFLVLGIPFGLLLMVFLKPNLSPDAPFHFLRIDEIAHGHVVSPRDRAGQAIASPDDCAAGVFTSMFSQWIDNSWHPSDAFHRIPCKARHPIVTSNTALNSPVAYVPAVIGYRVGTLLGSSALGLWLARLAGLATYLALCWAAIRLTPWGRPVLFLVALLPTSMTLAANLSADPLAISLGLLATALLLRLRVPRHDEVPDRTGRLLVALAACLFLLAASKNLYAPVVLTAFLVPADRVRTLGRRLAYGAGVVGSVALASGLWSVLVVDKVRFILFWNGADSIRQKAWIRAHPVGYLRIVGHSLFGTWLLVNHTIPGMAAPAWWHLQSRAPGVGESTVSLVVTVALIVGAFLLACRPRSGTADEGGAGARLASRREELLIWAVLGVILVLVFALVVYGESVASAADLRTNPVINYIEGRYFLPILPLLLLPLAARGRLLDGATTRAWAWALPVSLVVLTGWTVARF
ncbi:MAG TPA: DUF2142 domain-containing protein, partial [Acidimicrobiales bacterium]